MEQNYSEIETEGTIVSNNEYLIWDDDSKWQTNYWWKWGTLWFVVSVVAAQLGNYLGGLYDAWLGESINIFPAIPFLTWNQIIYTFITILVISGMQWAVLKYHIEDAYNWIFYSVGGHLLGAILFPILMDQLFYPLAEMLEEGQVYSLFFFIAVLISTVTALVQALVLRNWFYGVRTWIVIIVMGFVLQNLMMLGITFIGQSGGGPIFAYLPTLELIARNANILFLAFAMMYMLQREFEIDAEFRGIIELDPQEESAPEVAL